MSQAASAIRRAYPAVLARTLAFTRSLADAEDAVHDAVERALQAWASTGMPVSPEAWLVTVAANAHRDRMRHARRVEARGDALDVLAELSPWVRIAVAEPEVLRGWKDSLLGLLFACCHPALDDGESAALSLSTVVGLSVGEVAAAFVVAPKSMEQRLTRARKRLRQHGDVDGMTPDRARERIDAVSRTIHLLFNEGYWSSTDDAPLRADLCRLAMGLAHSLAETYPDVPEVVGLLALLTLHDARRPARLDERGTPVPLPEQDRTRWDHEGIRRGTALLDRALGLGAPGPMQTEAAIAAVHCRAATAEATDWGQIAALYALLEGYKLTPAVRVNRAFAVGRATSAARGLALLDERDVDVDGYPYVHVVRASLLSEVGDAVAADRAFREAERVARNSHERRQIRERREKLSAYIHPTPGDSTR